MFSDRDVRLGLLRSRRRGMHLRHRLLCRSGNHLALRAPHGRWNSLYGGLFDRDGLRERMLRISHGWDARLQYPPLLREQFRVLRERREHLRARCRLLPRDLGVAQPHGMHLLRLGLLLRGAV